MEFRRADIQEGQSSFFKMSSATGVEFYGRMEYREICRPCRIVYVQRFCDEQENVARHPALPVFPEAMLTTVEFAEEDGNGSRATVSVTPLGAVTPDEHQAFTNARAGMTLGWTGSFDELDQLLTP